MVIAQLQEHHLKIPQAEVTKDQVAKQKVVTITQAKLEVLTEVRVIADKILGLRII